MSEPFTKEQEERVRLLARIEAKRMLRRMLASLTGPKSVSHDSPDDDDEDDEKDAIIV